MSKEAPTERAPTSDAITGVHLMQGIGHQPTRGFWTEAWADVTRRPAAIAALGWLSLVIFFGAFAPFIANGHPLWVHDTETGDLSSPLVEHLSAVDVLLAAGLVVALALWFAPVPIEKQTRLRMLFFGSLQAGCSVLIAMVIDGYFGARDAPDFARQFEQTKLYKPIAAAVAGLTPALIAATILMLLRLGWHAVAAVVLGLVLGGVLHQRWDDPPDVYDYAPRAAQGEIEAVYTLIPFGPQQGETSLDLRQPGRSTLAAVIDGVVTEAAKRKGGGGFADDPRFQRKDRSPNGVSMSTVAFDDAVMEDLRAHLEFARPILREAPEDMAAQAEQLRASGELRTLADVARWLEGDDAPRFIVGTDSLGQDALSQLIHACRLSISVGLVSTSIAVVIGVTIGAIMGYFGGKIDLLLYRVVEIFMSMPVLFLLIVAAAVLPRNTYMMMIIIGCVTWTGAARFTRAEFYKLRDQDFVQSARAAGLPLWSVLFKHMLPNGVTPVLVDASFAIASAILAEAVLSYLGLGPANQASWGKLLSDATNQVGNFVWWLAIFPGLAIFLTVLAYNLIGEALRDAIDPRRKKARV